MPKQYYLQLDSPCLAFPLLVQPCHAEREFLCAVPPRGFEFVWASGYDKTTRSSKINMDTNPAKRRKVGHHESRGPVADGSAALDAIAQAGTPRSSTFVLQTQELLREVRLDYNKTFAGADELLHRIKSTLEATKAHDPTPVSPPPQPSGLMACD